MFFLEGFLQGPSSVFPLFFVALSVNPGVNRPPPYGKILFQKVASGYLLHSVQDGSSKHVLDKRFLHKHIKNQKHGGNALYSPP